MVNFVTILWFMFKITKHDFQLFNEYSIGTSLDENTCTNQSCQVNNSIIMYSGVGTWESFSEAAEFGREEV